MQETPGMPLLCQLPSQKACVRYIVLERYYQQQQQQAPLTKNRIFIVVSVWVCASVCVCLRIYTLLCYLSANLRPTTYADIDITQ